MINEIKFKNFKLFKNWQSLELRPITIIIGKNNSGKSAVVKLPTLISGSLSGDFKQPLRVENNGVRLGVSYEDLVYNRYIANNLELKIASDSEELEVNIFADYKNNIQFTKHIYNKESTNVKTTKMQGFLKEKKPYETLNLKYDYIGPFRILPKPNYPIDFDDYEMIGIKGENAYSILIQHDNTKMFTQISNWYKENFDGWGLKISKISGLAQSFEVGLEHDGIVPINLVNVGQGIHQVLPLIVRSYMSIEEETLIIIEEPETHLHPAAHGNLAQRFAESHIEDKNKFYLVETHSQNFVLRMRRMVAEGKFNHDDLAIYHVEFDAKNRESVLKRIAVDANGNLPNNDWPKGVFSETSIETRAIYNAQINDLSDVG